MIPPRFIPVLLIDRNQRVVKTVGFGERTYIGDPFNIIRLFNEKEVDEICVLDIDATRQGQRPAVDFLRALAAECFMPLSYGGGLRDLADVRQLAHGGVEKFVIGSQADQGFIGSLAAEFGQQAVVGCVDYRGSAATGSCFAHSGQRALGVSPLAHARALVAAGCGEILLQSMDRDGSRAGMDIEGIRVVAAELPVPVIAAGGAGQVADLQAVVDAGATAAASGSAFCFIGRLRAVLVTYPAYADRQALARAT